PDFAIEEVGEMFKQWQRDKREDILGYRDRRYRSTITGTLAPPHHTPWMQAMDDSLEAFLRESRELEAQPLPESEDKATVAEPGRGTALYSAPHPGQNRAARVAALFCPEPSPAAAGRTFRVSKGGGRSRRRRPGDMERKGLPAAAGPIR